MLRLALSLWPVGCALLYGSVAAADDAWRARDGSYYRNHWVIIGVELGATYAAHVISGDHQGRWEPEGLCLDKAVRRNFNDSPAQLSDRLGALAGIVPLAAQLSGGFDRAFANSGTIYAEVHSTNLLLTMLTKESVRRPRPYVDSDDAAVLEFAKGEGREAYVSFYSGHSSTSHAAAMAGSLLYAARTTEPWARHFMWGSEFLLAGLTAQLRITAGRHYRTDVWVGSLVGAAIGLAIPALHGVPLSRVRASEAAVAAGAAVLSHVGAELVDVCEALSYVRACSPTAKAAATAEASSESASSLGLQAVTLVPLVGESMGLSVAGEW